LVNLGPNIKLSLRSTVENTHRNSFALKTDIRPVRLPQSKEHRGLLPPLRQPKNTNGLDPEPQDFAPLTSRKLQTHNPKAAFTSACEASCPLSTTRQPPHGCRNLDCSMSQQILRHGLLDASGSLCPSSPLCGLHLDCPKLEPPRKQSARHPKAQRNRVSLPSLTQFRQHPWSHLSRRSHSWFRGFRSYRCHTLLHHPPLLRPPHWQQVHPLPAAL
jgi:hypothetical protein